MPDCPALLALVAGVALATRLDLLLELTGRLATVDYDRAIATSNRLSELGIELPPPEATLSALPTFAGRRCAPHVADVMPTAGTDSLPSLVRVAR